METVLGYIAICFGYAFVVLFCLALANLVKTKLFHSYDSREIEHSLFPFAFLPPLRDWLEKTFFPASWEKRISDKYKYFFLRLARHPDSLEEFILFTSEVLGRAPSPRVLTHRKEFERAVKQLGEGRFLRISREVSDGIPASWYKPSERTQPEEPAQPTREHQNAAENAKEEPIRATQDPPPEEPPLEEPPEEDSPLQDPPEEEPPEEEPPNKEPPEKDPPKAYKPQDIIVGVAVDGENANNQLTLEPSLRIRHLYLIGKTRTGKTTLIKNLALQDMEQGAGICFVDPHGDAAEDLVGCIPRHRLPDVIYFDPASDYAPAFNIFRLPYPPYKLTEDIMSVMKMLLGFSGYQMEHIMSNAIDTLVRDVTPRTLADIRPLLVNPDFRAEILSEVTAASLREFWDYEFPKMKGDAINPVLNKFSSLFREGSPTQKIFSQKENDLDFTRILNGQKILIVNLAKGKLGDEPSRLLGGLIVTGIQQAALAHAEMPPNQRKDFYLYLDEFQNFIVESFSSILSESAKYKLYLTLAHQTLEQVPPSLKGAIFGNVATLICFQISADDARTMQKEMHRTRYMYRQPNAANFYNLDDLLDARREELRNQAAEWQREIDSMGTLEEYARTHPNQDPGTARHNWRGVRAFNASKRDKILGMLTNLSHGNYTLGFIRELYPDLEFKQTTYPDIDDFINQQSRHAFCRKERAENVTLFRTLPAPEPKPQLRAAILQEMKARYANRKPEPTQEQPQEHKPRFTFSKPNAAPPPAEEPAAEASPVDDIPPIPAEEPERPAPASVKEFLKEHPNAAQLLNEIRKNFRDEVAYWHGKLKELGSSGAYIRHHKEMRPDAAEAEWRSYNREWKQNMNRAAARLSRLASHNLTLATLKELFSEYFPTAQPSPEKDTVKAARERRAQQQRKTTTKKSSASKTPPPQTDDDFNF